MITTVNVLCYKSKTLTNGEHPLMIPICKDGKNKYIGLGMSVHPDNWDFEKNKPKRKCPIWKQSPAILHKAIGRFPSRTNTISPIASPFLSPLKY